MRAIWDSAYTNIFMAEFEEKYIFIHLLKTCQSIPSIHLQYVYDIEK